MKNLFMKFLKEEDGATIIEYVIMLSIIAAIVLFAFPSLRSNIANWFGNMLNNTSGGLDSSNLDTKKLCPTGETWDATAKVCK